jgi:hypothetical protein
MNVVFLVTDCPATSTYQFRSIDCTLTSSVALTVRDDVDNEEGVTESENDDSETLESVEHESDRPAAKVYVPGRLLCSVIL